MKAMILIGGFGTRLRPLTCNTPKPLLPVINKPFLLYQIELIKKHGIKDIILCMAYLPLEFKRYFGDGKKFGVNISYAIEKMPLGTGGAIKNAEKYVDCPVLIFNGDVLTDLDLTDLIKYHKQKKSKATITLVEVDDPTSFGLVETNKNGNILQFLEKPSANQITCNTINAGTYIFEPEILKEIPENTVYSVERGLFPNLLNKKYPFYGFVYSGYWIDIGTMEKYLQVHHDLMNKMKKNSVGNNSKLGKNIKIDGKLLIGDNSAIGDNVIIEGNVCIGNDVIIANHCTLIDCIILDGTKIHEGSKIEKSLIGKNCLLETNSVLSSGCAIGDNTIIRSYSRL
ncbi:MAG TPA: nucleotidyltransferase [Elusimicrobia bacterium]|nr:nucleotidyltransferase [Elusimicrobiota bacterium]